MTVRIAINGFGRIGRNIVRALYESKRYYEITVVAINELANAESIAYLLKYDTSHGKFSWDIHQENEYIFIDTTSIKLFHEKKIEKLPWNKLNIDVVLDCTGIYKKRKNSEEHLAAGAKKVLLSYPGNQDIDTTIVYGVNHHELLSDDRIVSNASCTINCVAPVIKLLDDAWGIEIGTITTIHSAMHDQPVIDSYKSDLRRSRSAINSIVPVDTKLAEGIAYIFPRLSNCFEAISVRVPTINVTAIDLNILIKNSVKNAFEVNKLLKEASKKEFKGILDYTESPLVSIDFNHNSHSVIVDGTQTRVSKNHLIKTFVWCDNEWGFANRMLDTALIMARKI